MPEQIDLKELAKRLSTFFPGLVETSETTNTITVMNRVRVNSDGVVEGKGLVAEKVRAIIREYTRDIASNNLPASSQTGEKETLQNPFRCQHCGLRLTRGRIYRRTIGGVVMLFCCKQCADHEEAEVLSSKTRAQ